jgi:ATP-binding cassette, subfamily B, bacterial CvaB/MchF/RaxB
VIDNLNLGFFNYSRIKLIRQTELSECGLTCIAMIASYHGFKVDLATLRRHYSSSMRGASLKSVMHISDRIGLAPRPVKVPLRDLKMLRLPAILHWNMNHFVVIERIHRNRAYILNPSGSARWMDLGEIGEYFTGVALELSPTTDFRKQDIREKLRLSNLWERVIGLKRGILQVLLLSVVLQAFALVSPYYMQLAVDRAIPAQDENFLFVLAFGFGLFMIINTIASGLRSFVLLWGGATIGFSLTTNIGRRLFRLPISWFEKRHIGDILSRFQSVKPIQDILLNGTVAGLIDGSIAILTLFIMIFYSYQLALLSIVAFVLYLVIRVLSFALERDAADEAIVARSVEQSMLIESVRGIRVLRLFSKEVTRHAIWQSRLTDYVNADARIARIGIWQSIANGLVFGFENIIAIYLAVSLVIGGGFSVGMVFAYMAYKGQFISRSSAFVDQLIKFKMLGLHLQRLSDIAMHEEDVSFTSHLDGDHVLDGCLELKNVSFRYSDSDPMIFENLNLRVESNEHIAITGPSGGGKSTLVKMLLGLVQPTDGELLIDGKAIGEFGYKCYHSQIAAVLQDDTLFPGTLADNIALFDEDAEQSKIVEAAKLASINDDILKMPLQYETLVGDMGSAVSGGQKQRILLARALYRKPRILIMDEGTAHLDIAHEKKVNDSIKNIGITRIIIAHRHETIEAADKIYIMNNGRLFQK